VTAGWGLESDNNPLWARRNGTHCTRCAEGMEVSNLPDQIEQIPNEVVDLV
jgi:hypothetical protein